MIFGKGYLINLIGRQGRTIKGKFLKLLLAAAPHHTQAMRKLIKFRMGTTKGLLPQEALNHTLQSIFSAKKSPCISLEWSNVNFFKFFLTAVCVKFCSAFCTKSPSFFLLNTCVQASIYLVIIFHLFMAALYSKIEPSAFTL